MSKPSTNTDALPDFYGILGVPPSATAERIKEAYRALVRKSHPDKTRDANGKLQPEAERELTEKCAVLNLAYETLSDPGKKADYTAAKRLSAAFSAAQDRAFPPPQRSPAPLPVADSDEDGEGIGPMGSVASHEKHKGHRSKDHSSKDHSSKDKDKDKGKDRHHHSKRHSMAAVKGHSTKEEKPKHSSKIPDTTAGDRRKSTHHKDSKSSHKDHLSRPSGHSKGKRKSGSNKVSWSSRLEESSQTSPRTNEGKSRPQRTPLSAKRESDDSDTSDSSDSDDSGPEHNPSQTTQQGPQPFDYNGPTPALTAELLRLTYLLPVLHAAITAEAGALSLQHERFAASALDGTVRQALGRLREVSGAPMTCWAGFLARRAAGPTERHDLEEAVGYGRDQEASWAGVLAALRRAAAVQAEMGKAAVDGVVPVGLTGKFLETLVAYPWITMPPCASGQAKYRHPGCLSAEKWY